MDFKMIQARYFGCILLLAVFIEIVSPLCVLESDFGFKINCAFKKSGLFRVRNLGGLKAHASIGFSLGDELGFEQSLTNLDPSRRRSVNVKNGAPPNLVRDASRTNKQEKRGKQNRIMMRPMAPPPSRPNQAAMDKLTSLHRRVSSTMQPIVVGPTVEAPSTISRSSTANQPRAAPTVTMAKPMPMGIPAFKPLPPKEDTLKVVPITAKYSPLQIPQSKGPGLAYQSEIYPQSHNQISKMVSQMTAVQYGQPIRITPNPIIVEPLYTPASQYQLNQFMPMPTPLSAPPTINPQFTPFTPFTQGLSIIPAPVFKQINTRPNPVLDPVPHQVHDLASYAYNTKKVDDYNSITGYSDDTVLKFSKEDINSKIAEIAKAGNISMEAVEAAIALRQQQLLSKYANLPTPTTTTTTTTTGKPVVVFEPEPEPEIVLPTQKPKRAPTIGKVMNAPREYYPVGYEKNFDDHFQSKVELPDTNFHCGDQKYFPGLYGDETLGCMVFHVCALTDDGLVMKSFLCPESTLFDQTILKCNWWFYVDCKNTRKLYDTNIPVSKSYQLMKALTFFSSYKKEMEDGRPANPEDVHGIKEAITILENQDNLKQETNIVPNSIQIVTPQPIIDERNNHKIEYTTDLTPIYRENRNINNTKIRNNTQRNQNNNSNNLSNSQGNSSEYKLITVKADITYNKTSSNASSSEVRDKTHRRRMTLRYSNSTNTKLSTTSKPTTTILTTSKPIEVTTSPVVSSPLAEIMKQEIQPLDIIQTTVKQEKLIDQLESSYRIDPASLENIQLPEVKRFYRSSAEKQEDKEMTVINNEKVQIVRPTPMARLVGQYATPLAVIAKLDEAVLGRQNNEKISLRTNVEDQVISRPQSIRKKKEVVTIITPQRYTDSLEKT